MSRNILPEETPLSSRTAQIAHINQKHWIIDAITASRLAAEVALHEAKANHYISRLRDKQTKGNILIEARRGDCGGCPSLLVGMAELEQRQRLIGT